jgi:hypothetical protein
MSNIPYPFIPIPRIFFKNGFLDSNKENFDRRLHFVTLTFSKCYAVPRINNGVSYDSFEFSCTYEDIAEQIDATPREVKYLFNLCVDLGFMIKTPNRIKNRENFFKWDASKFICEKTIILNDSLEESNEKVSDQNLDKNNVHNLKNCPTNYREENDKKCPIKDEQKESFKNEKIVRSNEKVSDQVSDHLQSVNDKKVSDRCTPSLRNKESLCLKETNINKEKSAIPIVDKDLSLFSDEKDLFVSAKENELAEHQKALEAYVSYRNIPNITSKTITRWLTKYSKDEIIEALGMVLSNGRTRVENPGGWIENALQKGIVRQERVKKQNIQFAEQMQIKNRHLIINSRYCKDKRFKDKEFYYHIDPQIFQSELRNCL